MRKTSLSETRSIATLTERGEEDEQGLVECGVCLNGPA